MTRTEAPVYGVYYDYSMNKLSEFGNQQRRRADSCGAQPSVMPLPDMHQILPVSPPEVIECMFLIGPLLSQ